MEKQFGKLIMDIARGENNPRNSEGAFLTRKDGVILFVYSRFTGGEFDAAAADICLMESRDDGESFQETGVILTCRQEEAVNLMSLTLMEMENGDVGLFYLNRKTSNLMRLWLRRSSDGGKTWSAPVLCTPQEGFFVVNNDRVIRLSTGRLIVPAALHRKGYGKEPGDGAYFDARSEAMYFYSDDDGVTWRTSPGKVVMPYASCCTTGLQEPGVVELKNGVLWGWARTDLGRQYEMFSLDGGLRWTPCQPSRFTSPNSPLCMKRAPAGELLAFWNPVPLANGQREDNASGDWTGGRTPFVFAVSRDDGQTFSQPVVLEDDPDSGYCYCAVHFHKDSVLLGYCAGRRGDKLCLTRLRVRKILLKDLLDAAETERE